MGDPARHGRLIHFICDRAAAFHNGRPLEAGDVKYSWERAVAPETRSPVAANYLDGILGVKEAAAGKRKDLPGVEVVDKQTLQVTIDRPRAYLLSMLTYPSGFVVCKEAIEKNDGVLDQHAMIGTGPFELDSYQPGQRLTLKANAAYWDGKPKIEIIEQPIILNPDTEYKNFETGQVDTSGVTITQYVQDKMKGRFINEYHSEPVAMIYFLMMHPVLQPAFAKKEVRQAFAMAIDRDRILKVAFKGVGTVSNGLLPPGMLGAEPSPTPLPYDPEKAKQLLAQAGYPNGNGFPTLTLSLPNNAPTVQAACQIIQSSLKTNLNVNVNL